MMIIRGRGLEPREGQALVQVIEQDTEMTPTCPHTPLWCRAHPTVSKDRKPAESLGFPISSKDLIRISEIEPRSLG